eukprot:7387951-Prymnesium_polylepis.1
MAEYAMPTFEVVWSQFLQLAERLRAAAAETTTSTSFGNRWNGASGTVISTDIWKHPNQFAKGVDAYLYLWTLCATKTQNEAVVEGMSSVWAASGEGVRHLELASSEKEA